MYLVFYIIMAQATKKTECTTKSMAFWLFFISACVFLHLWCVTRVLDLTSGVNSMFAAKKQLAAKKYTSLTKYILLWGTNTANIIENGRSIFPSLKCFESNCIFTKDKGFFEGDYTRFNAILFNDDVLKTKERSLKRASSQLYIFHSLESAYSVPACEVYNDGFFNLTLTSRLDSNIVWSYFEVRNLKGRTVAPSISVKWNRKIRPIKMKIKRLLARKKRAAAWLVSHCRADSFRDDYLTRLQEHLFHFALKIDVYGECSGKTCRHNNCDRMIKNDYYFYMAFENSFSEDYVTEKIMHGYRNYAVPIVYGGANYSRFLPPGSYINAREMHPYNLAFAMYQAIQSSVIYETYFTWTNFYTITSKFKTHPLCKLCSRLHSGKESPAKQNFRIWWNTPNGMKWCLSQEFWNETNNVNLDLKHVLKLN